MFWEKIKNLNDGENLSKNFQGFELSLAQALSNQREFKSIIEEYSYIPDEFHSYWNQLTESFLLKFLLMKGTNQDLEQTLLDDNVSQNIKEQILKELNTRILEFKTLKNLIEYYYKTGKPDINYYLINLSIEEKKEISTYFIENDNESLIKYFDKLVLNDKMAFEILVSYNIKNYDLRELLTKTAISFNNEVFAYTLLSKGLIEFDFKNQIIELALTHVDFEITQINDYVISDVINYAIDNKHYYYDFKFYHLFICGVIVARKNEDSEIIYKVKIEKEVKDKIHKIFKGHYEELPNIINGYVNVKLKKFISNDVDCTLLKWQLDKNNNQDLINFCKPMYMKAIATKMKGYFDVIKQQSTEYYSVTITEDFKKNPIEYSNDKLKLLESITERLKVVKGLIDSEKLSLTNRAFGIELEICTGEVTPQEISKILGSNPKYSQLNEDEMGKTNFPNNEWIAKPDRSIKVLDPMGKLITQEELLKKGFKSYSIEITSPKLSGIDGIKEISEKLKFFITLKDSLSVNSSCGFHIHHDITDVIESQERLSKNTEIQDELISKLKSNFQKEFYKLQSLIYGICDENRKDNPYCYQTKLDKSSTGIADIPSHYLENATMGTSNFRPGFNPMTVHNTIEFRMFQGTLDLMDIQDKILLTHEIVESIIKRINEEREDSSIILNRILNQLECLKLELWEKKLKNNEDISEEDFDNFYKVLNLNANIFS